jgi:hypothetical protein
MRRLEAEDSEVPKNELIEIVLRNVGFEYIPAHHRDAKELYEATKGLIYGSEYICTTICRKTEVE